MLQKFRHTQDLVRIRFDLTGVASVGLQHQIATLVWELVPVVVRCLSGHHCGAIESRLLPLLKLWLVVVIALILPLPAAGEVVLVAGEPGVHLLPLDMEGVVGVLDLRPVSVPLPILALEEVIGGSLIKGAELVILADVRRLMNLTTRRLQVHHVRRRRRGFLHGGVLAAAAICRLLVEGLLLGE